MKNDNLGFTLLEITIVLLILGLLIAGILGPLSTKVEQKQRQETQEKLDQIKDALYGFAITNGRLPCPDTDALGAAGYGTENLTSESCSIANGTVPFTTLGINASVDAWNNPFVYRITENWADDPSIAITANGTACGNATDGVSFELCSVGDITINNIAGTIIVDDIPVLVFSGGKNDFTTGAPEGENTNDDTTFVYSDIRMVSGAEYDDLMIWISPNILKYRMVQAGRLP